MPSAAPAGRSRSGRGGAGLRTLRVDSGGQNPPQYPGLHPLRYALRQN